MRIFKLVSIVCPLMLVASGIAQGANETVTDPIADLCNNAVFTLDEEFCRCVRPSETLTRIDAAIGAGGTTVTFLRLSSFHADRSGRLYVGYAPTGNGYVRKDGALGDEAIRFGDINPQVATGVGRTSDRKYVVIHQVGGEVERERNGVKELVREEEYDGYRVVGTDIVRETLKLVRDDEEQIVTSDFVDTSSSISISVLSGSELPFTSATLDRLRREGKLCSE